MPPGGYALRRRKDEYYGKLKELGKVVGGVLGSIRPGGNASGKDFIG